VSHSPVQTVGAILTPIVTLATLAWGGKPERIVALASLLAYVASPLAQTIFAENWPLWGVAAIDVLLCAVMVAMALNYDRNWLILAAGVEVATVMAHVGMAVSRTQVARGYVISLWLFYFLFLATLIYALFEVRDRRMRGLEAR